jgi:L-ascorbate metabolism protein UlaG (beta-lactamase superfamily)
VDDSLFAGKPGTLLAATLLTLSMQFPATAQETMETDTIATSMGDLVVHPIHHASMRLAWNGLTILVDPAPPPGAPEGGDVTAEYSALPPPDLILVTHEHGDHFNADILAAVSGGATIVAPQAVADKMPDALKAKTKVMANGETAEVAGVPVEAIASYNITPDRLNFHPKGRDNGYVLTFGDKRVYIAGDTEDTPEMRALKDIDAAFIPMNLPYTMDVNQAASAVSEFKPAAVYPFHYGDSDVNAFATQVGDASDMRLLKWY